jgi:NDP-sugar pyrophosphorylase family protein
LTETIPKALIEVNGRPFLSHQLDLLKRAGDRKVLLLVGHLGEKIREAVRQPFADEIQD